MTAHSPLPGGLAAQGAMGHFGPDAYLTCTTPAHWRSMVQDLRDAADGDPGEAGEVEIGLCPCGKGYNGHTTHEPDDGHEATGPGRDLLCTTCRSAVYAYSPDFDSAELRHGGLPR